MAMPRDRAGFLMASSAIAFAILVQIAVLMHAAGYF